MKSGESVFINVLKLFFLRISNNDKKIIGLEKFGDAKKKKTFELNCVSPVREVCHIFSHYAFF